MNVILNYNHRIQAHSDFLVHLSMSQCFKGFSVFFSVLNFSLCVFLLSILRVFIVYFM